MKEKTLASKLIQFAKKHYRGLQIAVIIGTAISFYNVRQCGLDLVEALENLGNKD